MRVALLSEFAASPRPGWPSTILCMAAALQRRGHDVEIWMGGDTTGPLLRGVLRRLRRQGEAAEREQRVARLAARARAEAGEYDVYLSVLGSRIARALPATRSIVHVSDATWYLVRQRYHAPVEAADWERAVEQETIDRAAAIVMTSEWARRSVIDHCGAEPARCHVLPLGANFACPADPLRDLAAWPRPRCELLFNGRDWQRKGGDVAVAIARLLHESGVPTRLTLIGGIPRDRRRPKAPYVRTLGWLEARRPRELARYLRSYAEAEFLLLPTRADCTPITCAEASSHAVPVLARDVGGVAAMVREGVSGYLFAADADAAEYAARIRELRASPERLRALRRSSREHYLTELSWEVWAQRMTPILESAAKQSGDACGSTPGSPEELRRLHGS